MWSTIIYSHLIFWLSLCQVFIRAKVSIIDSDHIYLLVWQQTIQTPRCSWNTAKVGVKHQPIYQSINRSNISSISWHCVIICTYSYGNKHFSDILCKHVYLLLCKHVYLILCKHWYFLLCIHGFFLLWQQTFQEYRV